MIIVGSVWARESVFKAARAKMKSDDHSWPDHLLKCHVTIDKLHYSI